MDKNKQPSSKSSSAKAAKNPKVYSSFSYKLRVNRERRARKDAAELSRLPKAPITRFFARLHPKRVFKFLFSWHGLRLMLKAAVAGVLLLIIAIGGLCLYFKKDLASIKLDELKVNSTVNTYLDRKGEVLWEDKGAGDYRLAVDGSNISTFMRQATVAIEDKHFYTHAGVDLIALFRAAISNLIFRRGTQGGSTLTQQLIKQVYFSEEAGNRSLTGLPRKIKEMILALEVEKMYSKEQLITMYLNESPYGGRRNGVESAAQTYFGKSAKDLDLAESALLAAIPNNPTILNPYNNNGHTALIARQHKTLDAMVELGYVTKEAADDAKAVPILDKIKPESGQYTNIKAPHFVLEVKNQLEKKYGLKMMRAGGFVIKTSLDYRAQQLAEAAVANGRALMSQNRSDNIALASVDVETGQVIAMVGSSDWNTPIYGQVNAATSLLEPGSSIKPILDYTPLLMQRDGQNFAPGSILRDENIDSIYCAGNPGKCSLNNYTGRFYGNVTIRQSLGNSLNIGAVKALYLNGLSKSLKIAHELGELSYCNEGEQASLAAAIGSGCSVRPIEHANTYASIARGGVYKPLAYILEIKNGAGEVIESWADNSGKRVVNDEVAYMIADILGDPQARTLVFGAQGRDFGFQIPGVWTGTKTGTTTTAISSVTKDSWIASFSTAIATVVWNGKHDGGGLANSSNTIVRRVVNDYMAPVHTQVYASDGKWRSGDQPIRPAGIKQTTINGVTDIWPSWYNTASSGSTTTAIEFNKYTKKRASACTPESFRVSIDATKTIDPITKKEFWFIPDGYSRDAEPDDCTYKPPTASLRYDSSLNQLILNVTAGTEKLNQYKLTVDDKEVETGRLRSGITILDYAIKGTETTAEITISDENGYSAKAKLNLNL